MSTNQPPGRAMPGGSQPDATPGYVPPQDPWGAYDPGVASMPTDPIHQPSAGYSGFGQYGQGEVWSQSTVPHGGQYGYVPQPPRKSRAGVIAVVAVVVLIFGGGAGAAAWYVTANRGVSPTSTATASAKPTGEQTADPHTIKVGDCIINTGTPKDPRVFVRPCETPDSYKVIFVATGADLPEGPEGKFDADTTSVQICKNTGYEAWFGSKDAADANRDVFFCLKINR